MRVFYDSNIVLDLLLNRQEFVADSSAALKLSETRIVKGYISVVSITDVFYLIRQNIKDIPLTIQKIKTLLKIVSVAKADEKIAQDALDSGWHDFEDAVQYSVAKKAHFKCIVTRNKKDFKQSTIPVYTPNEFVKMFN